MKVLPIRCDIVVKASDKAISQYCDHCERLIETRGLRVIDIAGCESFFCNGDCWDEYNADRFSDLFQ